MTDLTTCQLSRRGRSQLDRLSEVRWLRYPGDAGIQAGRSDTGVLLGQLDAHPDGQCPTGSVDVAAGDSGCVNAGASAVWSSWLYMPTGLTISGGTSLTRPTDASAVHGLVGTHNVCGYTDVPVVPGGPGLLWPSSEASPGVRLTARQHASSLTKATLLRTPAGFQIPNGRNRDSTDGSDFGLSGVRIAVYPDSPRIHEDLTCMVLMICSYVHQTDCIRPRCQCAWTGE